LVDEREGLCSSSVPGLSHLTLTLISWERGSIWGEGRERHRRRYSERERGKGKGRERERERLVSRLATSRHSSSAGASINTQEVLSLTAPLGQSIPDAIAPPPSPRPGPSVRRASAPPSALQPAAATDVCARTHARTHTHTRTHTQKKWSAFYCVREATKGQFSGKGLRAALQPSQKHFVFCSSVHVGIRARHFGLLPVLCTCPLGFSPPPQS